MPSLDDTPERSPEERERTRRALGWLRPEGARFRCLCGLATDSPAEARHHAEHPPAGPHAMQDGRDGTTSAFLQL